MLKNIIMVAQQIAIDVFTVKEVSQLKVWEVLLVVVLSIFTFILVKFIVKLFIKGLKSTGGFAKRKMFKSYKQKASGMTCKVCSRRLDACVCVDNKNLSLRQRVKKELKRKK